MAAKQIQQALTSLNCQIPYVIGSDYRVMSETAQMGCIRAKDDGEVLFLNDDLLIVRYINLNKVQDIQLPAVKKTAGTFATKLRYFLPEHSKFKKGDILATYDCFIGDVPSYGYNVFTAFVPWFGFNHEDAIVISESLAERITHTEVEKVYIPIYEYTLMQQLYSDYEDSYIYFPNIGQKIRDNTICSMILPRDSSSHHDLKNKIQMVLKSMSLSDLISMQFAGNGKFSTERIKTKIDDGKVSGIKIHIFKKFGNSTMIDQKLEKILDKLYLRYSTFVVNEHNKMSKQFNSQYVEYLLRKHYVFVEKSKTSRGEISLNNLCYLIEMEITSEKPTVIGDKLANRYANKGVVSLILPDDLRPVAINSNKTIDLIFNPFGVFSRMNLGQLLEAIVGKSVMYCDEHIKQHPENVKETIIWLNESILKYIDQDYYKRINDEIIQNLDNEEFRNRFLNSINESNLFVEAPCFAEVDIKNLLRHAVDYKEPVLLKKSLITFMRQKLKLEPPFPDQDIYLKNILCAPIYIQKLYKLVSKTITARDFGSVKTITKQPTKGRSRGGGSKVGQMELESMLASGCDLAVKEILSVKSDWVAGKKDLLRQIVLSGEYCLPENRTIRSRTKEVVDICLNFLKE